MDYKIFGQLDKIPYARENGEDEQTYMQRILREAFQTEPADKTEHIYERMLGKPAGCSYENNVLEMEFPVEEWELNPMRTMHGGLLTTAVDMTCGILVRFYKRSISAVTIHLSVDFMNPLACGEVFVVRARINKMGRRVVFLTAEVVSKDSGRTAATASGTFM